MLGCSIRFWGRPPMHHVLAEYGLRLTYLRNPSVVDDLDTDRVLEDLSDDTLDGDVFPWLAGHQLNDHDHLILATDRHTGQYLGVLGACDGATTGEEFLILEAAFVAAAARGQNLLRRMIALALLRIGSLGPLPSAIAASTRSPICYRILRGIAHSFSQASLFPEPANVPINFHAATLAQRIAHEIHPNCRFQITTSTIRGAAPPVDLRQYQALSNDLEIDGLFDPHMQPADEILVVLDLRGGGEATILDDARLLYRARSVHTSSRAPSASTGHFRLANGTRRVPTVIGTNDAPNSDGKSFTSAKTP
jgi:hypothetical protein